MHFGTKSTLKSNHVPKQTIVLKKRVVRPATLSHIDHSPVWIWGFSSYTYIHIWKSHFNSRFTINLYIIQGTAIRDRIQERLRGQQSNRLLENGKENSEDEEEEYYDDDDDYDDEEEYFDNEEYYAETYNKDAKIKN